MRCCSEQPVHYLSIQTSNPIKYEVGGGTHYGAPTDNVGRVGSGVAVKSDLCLFTQLESFGLLKLLSQEHQ